MHVQWFYILEGFDFTTCPYVISFKHKVPLIPIMKITGYGQTWENRFKPQRKASLDLWLAVNIKVYNLLAGLFLKENQKKHLSLQGDYSPPK